MLIVASSNSESQILIYTCNIFIPESNNQYLYLLVLLLRPTACKLLIIAFLYQIVTRVIMLAYDIYSTDITTNDGKIIWPSIPHDFPAADP